MVRRPRARRTAAAWRAPGWYCGANRKQRPTSSSRRREACGGRSMTAPRASRTSADPGARRDRAVAVLRDRQAGRGRHERDRGRHVDRAVAVAPVPQQSANAVRGPLEGEGRLAVGARRAGDLGGRLALDLRRSGAPTRSASGAAAGGDLGEGALGRSTRRGRRRAHAMLDGLAKGAASGLVGFTATSPRTQTPATFSSSVCPAGVRIDSGWNWKPICRRLDDRTPPSPCRRAPRARGGVQGCGGWRANGTGPRAWGSGRPAKGPVPSWASRVVLPWTTAVRAVDHAAGFLHDRLMAEAHPKHRDDALRAPRRPTRHEPASSGLPGPGESTTSAPAARASLEHGACAARCCGTRAPGTRAARSASTRLKVNESKLSTKITSHGFSRVRPSARCAPGASARGAALGAQGSRRQAGAPLSP